MNRVVKDYLMLLGVSGTIIGLDQWTKWLVRTSIPFGEQWLPEWLIWLEPYARFVHWYNKGAAFGMFQQGAMVFTILAFIVIGAILYYFPRVDVADWPLRLALSLQMAGAAGNLIDRLTLGHVTDFISVGTFPVFNIADASITVGVAVLIVGAWYQERKNKQENKPQTSSEEIPQA